jgi:hypothetical protein
LEASEVRSRCGIGTDYAKRTAYYQMAYYVPSCFLQR